jgi:Na+-transporting NADH:ubiquinone oxidoreductase subunit NqrD
MKVANRKNTALYDCCTSSRVLWLASKTFLEKVIPRNVSSGARSFVQLYVWSVLVKVVRQFLQALRASGLLAAPP